MRITSNERSSQVKSQKKANNRAAEAKTKICEHASKYKCQGTREKEGLKWEN